MRFLAVMTAASLFTLAVEQKNKPSWLSCLRLWWCHLALSGALAAACRKQTAAEYSDLLSRWPMKSELQ
jgi:hypothetical protein